MRVFFADYREYHPGPGRYYDIIRSIVVSENEETVLQYVLNEYSSTDKGCWKITELDTSVESEYCIDSGEYPAN